MSSPYPTTHIRLERFQGAAWLRVSDLVKILSSAGLLTIFVLIFAAVIQFAYFNFYLKIPSLATADISVKIIPDIANVVGLLGFATGIFTLLKGIGERDLAKTWKHKEFVASQMQSFFDDPKVALSLIMIESYNNRIDFSSTDPKLKNIRVDWQLVSAALVPERCGKTWWTGLEGLVISDFDRFLDRLGYFYVIISAGVITRYDLSPYLSYWLDVIFGVEQCHATLRRNLHIYIDNHHKNVWLLGEEFGHARPTPGEIERLAHELRHEVLQKPNGETGTSDSEGLWSVATTQDELRTTLRLARSQAERRGAFHEMNLINARLYDIETSRGAIVLTRDLPPDLPFIELLAALEKRDRAQPNGQDIELAWGARQAICRPPILMGRAEGMGVKPSEWKPHHELRARLANSDSGVR